MKGQVMKNCNAETIKNRTKSQAKAEETVNYPAYIELDVHSQTIAVAIAWGDGSRRRRDLNPRKARLLRRP
jgi:hypothetical protein